MLIRWLIAKLIRPILPMLARRDYRQQDKFIKDCGSPTPMNLSYQAFLNEYEKELRYWIKTGRLV